MRRASGKGGKRQPHMQLRSKGPEQAFEKKSVRAFILSQGRIPSTLLPQGRDIMGAKTLPGLPGGWLRKERKQMMNPAMMMKAFKAKKEFEDRHPRVLSFIQNEIMTGIEEGTVLEMTVTKPGRPGVTANMRITAEDLAWLEELKNMGANMK